MWTRPSGRTDCQSIRAGSGGVAHGQGSPLFFHLLVSFDSISDRLPTVGWDGVLGWDGMGRIGWQGTGRGWHGKGIAWHHMERNGPDLAGTSRLHVPVMSWALITAEY